MSKINWSDAGVRVLKATLEAYAPLAAALRFPGQAANVIRIYGEFVPPETPPPYVTIEWYGGGADNDTRTDAGMLYWKVAAAVKEDHVLSKQLQDMIFLALNWKQPVIVGDPGYAGYAPILSKYPYTDTVYRSGVSLQRSGGIYSLCLAETKE